MNPISPGTTVGSLKGDGGGAPEQSYVKVVSAGTGAFESFILTCPAGDEAAQADYFSFTEPGGRKFAVWLDIDADGTAPSGAIYTAADSKIEVNIVSVETPDSAAEVAAKLVAAIEADLDFLEFDVVDNEDGTLMFTANLVGDPADAAPHNTGDTGAGSFLVEVNDGADASSQNDYFIITDSAGDLYHVWLNVNGEGTDPAPESSTEIEVELSAGDSVSQVALAIATAINANAKFESQADGNRVKITTDISADVVDIESGDSGFIVRVSTQGYARQRPGPSTATSSLKNF